VTPVQLAPEVGRIDPGVIPIGDRRDRERRQREFPEISERDSEEKPPEAESGETPGDGPARSDDRPASREQEDEDRTIDLLVLGLILPTRQQLPGRALASLLH
jgi:hypothetical protein